MMMLAVQMICVILLIGYHQTELHHLPTEEDIYDAFYQATIYIVERNENINFQNYYFGRRYDHVKGPYAAYLRQFGRYLETERIQEVLEETTRILKQSFQLTPWEVVQLKEIDLRSILPDVIEKCMDVFEEFACDPFYPYRTADSRCNNLEHPTWGKSFECFGRMFVPQYSDGVSAVRKSVTGAVLPTPRTISVIIDPDVDVPSKTLNVAYVMFGQLITHDMTFSPKPAIRPLGITPKCCPKSDDNPTMCAPFDIPTDDPFYSNYNITCLDNARTHLCTTCKLGYRDQVNQFTSFIDASVVYGMTDEVIHQMRTFDGTGTIKTQDIGKGHVGELFMQSEIPTDDSCSFQEEFSNCFEGGDVQLNQHTLMTTIVLIFHRQHNTIARTLHLINKHWDDERIFQEARRILGAQMQVITYREFLPRFIGIEAMKKYDLYINEHPAYTKYDPNINPTITTEFSASAFRSAHSIIMRGFPLYFHGKVEDVRLQNTFKQPYQLYKPGFFEAITTGMSKGPNQEFDRFIVTDITDHFLQFRGNATGMDLTALDISRDRDHGMPPYVDVVKFCSGREIETFEDLIPIFGKENVKYYEKVYNDVRDIELLIGGYSEKPVKGGIVGPTTACIVAIQFSRLKYGDRFYLEHGNEIGSFTPAQLQELKNTRLSRLVCDNSAVDKLQENMLFLPNEFNPVKFCEDLPQVDYSVFMD